MNELKAVLGEGGNTQMEDNKVIEPVIEDEFNKKPDEEEEKKVPEEKGKTDEENKSNSEEDKKDEKSEEDPKKDEDEDEKKNKKFSLEEIPEYVELSKNFAALQKDYDALQEEVTSLRSFKASAERAAKEEMIKGFYMLSDADKKDCLDNIDKYSLDDIEAKLSIICVRNKVNFNLDEDKKDENPENPTVYTLGDNDDGDSAPAWIKAVRNTAKEMN